MGKTVNSILQRCARVINRDPADNWFLEGQSFTTEGTVHEKFNATEVLSERQVEKHSTPIQMIKQ